MVTPHRGGALEARVEEARVGAGLGPGGKRPPWRKDAASEGLLQDMKVAQRQVLRLRRRERCFIRRRRRRLTLKLTSLIEVVEVVHCHRIGIIPYVTCEGIDNGSLRIMEDASLWAEGHACPMFARTLD